MKIVNSLNAVFMAEKLRDRKGSVRITIEGPIMPNGHKAFLELNKEDFKALCAMLRTLV